MGRARPRPGRPKARPAAPPLSLPTQFLTNPGGHVITMKGADLRTIRKREDGWILACGKKWTIMSRPVGQGLHEVWLEERIP